MGFHSATVEAAIKLQQSLMDNSPLIEELTCATCPSCTDVCCRQKHGTYQERDRIYLEAIGVPIPQTDRSRLPDSHCEFLGERGCIHPRWLRPFKCTWYFCGPLLKAMDEQPARSSRRLSGIMEEMIKLYDQLEE